MDDERIALVAERSDILDLLAGESLSKRDLVDRLDASRSTVDRAIRDLEDADLVERSDGECAATPAGRLAVERYRSYISESGDVLGAEDVLGALPPDTDLGVEALAGADIYTSTDPDPFGPAERLHGAIREADRYEAVLPALDDPRHLRLLYEHVVTDGDPATLTVTEDLFGVVRERFPRRLAAMADVGTFEVGVGESPAYGLVLTETADGAHAEADATAFVVVFAESGALHGVIRNDGDRATRWARDRIEAAHGTAADATERLREPAADGAVAGSGGTVLVEPDRRLPIPLEREGFVALSPDYFADRRVADPTTAWRAGLDLAEVHTGYAVDRPVETEDGTLPLRDRLRESLADGEDCIVLGPPGSGKSTVCKQVAAEWYADDRGPVFYRESGRGHPFDSSAALVETVEAADGHALVVVEDAVRPDPSGIFSVLPDLSERDDVSVLLDARESEWQDPPADLDESGRAAAGSLETVAVPDFDSTDADRIVEHFERTVGESVDVSPEGLLSEVREESTAGEESAPSELLLFFHRLSLYADPLGEAATTLDEEVATVIETLRERGEGALDVAALANVLNAVGAEVAPGHAHAVADEETAREALDALEGRVVFPDGDGAYRTVHETWSVNFLERLLAVDDDPTARVGQVLSRLLSLADDPERRDRLSTVVDGREAWLDAVEDDPGGWAEDLLERTATLAQARPKVAPLFGDPTPSVTVPDACPPDVKPRLWTRLGRGHLGTGDTEGALAVFDSVSIPDDDLDEERARSLRFDLRHQRSSATRIAGDFEEAERLARSLREDAVEAGDDVTAALALSQLAKVSQQTGDLDRARSHFEDSLETLRERGPDRVVAGLLRTFGGVERMQGNFEAAERRYRESLDICERLGLRPDMATLQHELGKVAERQGDLQAAERHQRRGLELARSVGRHEDEILCLQRLGILNEHTGDREQALEYYRTALDLAREIDDKQQIAACLGNMAPVFIARGDFETAEDHYRNAVETARELGNRPHEATLLQNLATMELTRDDLGAAARYADRCLDMVEETGQQLLGITARAVLSTVHVRQGSLETALEHAREADDIAEQGGYEQQRPEVGGELGRVLHLVGEYGPAREHLERGLEVARALDDTKNAAELNYYLAALDRRTGHLDRAKRRAEDAQSGFADLEDDANRVRSQALLASIDRAGGDVETAADRLSDALDSVPDGETAAIDVRRELGTIARLRGEYDEAADHLRTALETAEELTDVPVAVRVRTELGRLAADRDDHETAREHLADASETAIDAGAAPLALDAIEALVEVCSALGDEAAARRWCERAIEMADTDALADRREWFRDRREAVPDAAD